MNEERLWGYSLGVCLVLGFIGFGYMLYQWIGVASLLLTALFIAITVISSMKQTKLLQDQREKEVHDRYERQIRIGH